MPVYADRGRAGGYRLVGGYRTRLTGLARGEAEALFLSGVPGALREMGLEDAASAARLKVSAALLPSLRDAPRAAAQRFHLDAPAWFREPETPDAAAGCSRTRCGTTGCVAGPLPAPGDRGGAGAGAVRARAQGGGLVPVRAGARATAGGAFRVYRIDRFIGARPPRDRFSRDEEFDLPGFWAEQAERFARSILRAEVVVRLSADGRAQAAVRRRPARPPGTALAAARGAGRARAG